MPRRAVLINTVPSPVEDVIVFEGDDADNKVMQYTHTKAHEDIYAEIVVKAWVVRNDSGYWRRLYRVPMRDYIQHWQRPPLREVFAIQPFFKAAVHPEGVITCTFYTDKYGPILFHQNTGYRPYRVFMEEYERIWGDIIATGETQYVRVIRFVCEVGRESASHEWQRR